MSKKEATVWQTDGAEATFALGRALGNAAKPGLVVALCGNLGVGKTILTQGIAAGLGITERVTSPTFIFVNEYITPAGFTLIHIDSYRLGDEPDVAALEAFTFGLDELLSRDDVMVVIEWADRLAGLLPPDHLQITLSYAEAHPTVRQIAAVGHGPESNSLLAELIHTYIASAHR